MRTPLVVGNWKMNGSLAANANLLDGLLRELQDLTVARCAVCVPYPYLNQVADLLKGSRIEWGAQNVSEHDAGAYTGEVAGTMLAEMGCSLVTVGHSERRTLFAESDQQVAAKYAAALKAGLTPILCVGESLQEREQGVTEAVVKRQLDAVVDKAGIAGLARGVVAYEPVWAIGTGKTATPELAQEAHAFIKSLRDLPVLYGGSVKPENAAELCAQPDVDGALVGGASLDVDSFAAICRAASRS